MEEGKKWISAGGYLDMTPSDEIDQKLAVDALCEYYQEGLDLSHVTLSSDGYVITVLQ